jgi:hypothetical protein
MGGPARSFHARKATELTEDLLQLAGKAATAGAVITVAYLLWGVFSGMATSWATLPAAERLRVEQNIHLAGRALLAATAVAAASFTLLYLRETTIGYLFLLLAAVLAFGVPLGVIICHPRQDKSPPFYLWL